MGHIPDRSPEARDRYESTCFHTLSFVPHHGCPLDVFFKFNIGFVTQQALSFRDIGARVGGITGLVRHDTNVGLAIHMLLHQLDKLLQGHSRSLAQIENFVLVRAINVADNTIDNVVNVRIISTPRDITKLLNLDAAAGTVNEFEPIGIYCIVEDMGLHCSVSVFTNLRGHIRTTTRTVDTVTDAAYGDTGWSTAPSSEKKVDLLHRHKRRTKMRVNKVFDPKVVAQVHQTSRGLTVGMV